MKAVRIKIHMDTATLTLSSPELKPFVGKNVEVIVLEEQSANEESRATTGYGFMRGTVVRDDDDPFGPAVPPEQWEAIGG